MALDMGHVAQWIIERAAKLYSYACRVVMEFWLLLNGKLVLLDVLLSRVTTLNLAVRRRGGRGVICDSKVYEFCSSRSDVLVICVQPVLVQSNDKVSLAFLLLLPRVSSCFPFVFLWRYHNPGISL